MCIIVSFESVSVLYFLNNLKSKGNQRGKGSKKITGCDEDRGLLEMVNGTEEVIQKSTAGLGALETLGQQRVPGSWVVAGMCDAESSTSFE